VTPILTALVFLVVGWFAAGTIWNVRKGSAAMRWMQGGLPLLGERTTVRWLGTTSVEMGIEQAKAPFAQVAVVVFLEPRDVPWLWALARKNGRRDTLIIRAKLRRTPDADLEVVDGQSWSGRDALRQLGTENWSERDAARPGATPMLIKRGGDVGRMEELLGVARGVGMEVRRLSIRRSPTHLLLHVDLPALTTDAAGFFRAVRGIGERALT
jgi:hypothetical protein